MRILINAYAVSPNMGSEPGMGWNWCVNLAKYCELEIITEGEFRDKIEAVVPTLPQGKNMHFHYNPVSDIIRRMCWNQGDWRFYWYYQKWQHKTLQIARDICKSSRIDIIHQLNMVGFREPGYLWKLSEEMDIPFVWGPIGGMEMTPLGYTANFPTRERLKAILKNLVNDWQRKHEPRVLKALRQASTCIAATKGAYEILHNYHHLDKVVLINETATNIGSAIANEHDFHRDILNLIWVGRFIPTKKLDLALETMRELKELPVHLDIVGTGNKTAVEWYQSYANKLGVESMVTWVGQISNDEVQQMMAKADAFFFTSVLESTSTVILEALSNHLPIICFDACGFGPIIDKMVGFKIPLTKQRQSVKDFAECIRKLLDNRDLLDRMSANCADKQQQYSWANNAKKMIDIYNRVTTNARPVFRGGVQTK